MIKSLKLICFSISGLYFKISSTLLIYNTTKIRDMILNHLYRIRYILGFKNMPFISHDTISLSVLFEAVYEGFILQVFQA